MNDARTFPDAEFAPAPLGTRERIATLAGVAVMILSFGVALALASTRSPAPPWQVYIACGISLPVYAAIWAGTRVRGYRLAGEALLVARAIRKVRLPLAGLTEARQDPDAMRGAWKIRGRRGLGMTAGRFWSKRLGRFDAYLSDRERAVVLRWPDRCVVVSPEQPAYFIDALRKRAGLSS